jgi:LysR family transcriptional activator of glutamate synthase operon
VQISGGFLKDHLSKLLSLRAIETAGSIRKASGQLRLTQPALTRQVKILEEILGKTILIRNRQGVKLTAAGQTLTAFAQKLSDQIEGLENELTRVSSSTPLRIGTFGSHSIRLWPKFAAAVNQSLGSTKIRLITGDTLELYDQVKEGTLDGALTQLEAAVPPALRQKVLYDDAYGLFISLNYPLPEKTIFEPEILNEIPLVAVQSSACRTGDELLTELRRMGFRPQQLVSVDTFEAAANYCREGVGVALLPYLIAIPALASHDIRSLATSVIPHNRFRPHRLGLIFRRDSNRKYDLKILESVLVSFFAQ